jgi:hypothetical protein
MRARVKPSSRMCGIDVGDAANNLGRMAGPILGSCRKVVYWAGAVLMAPTRFNHRTTKVGPSAGRRHFRPCGEETRLPQRAVHTVTRDGTALGAGGVTAAVN